VNHS